MHEEEGQWAMPCLVLLRHPCASFGLCSLHLPPPAAYLAESTEGRVPAPGAVAQTFEFGARVWYVAVDHPEISVLRREDTA